jgi:predicted GNAT superfamily acetyltransferase
VRGAGGLVAVPSDVDALRRSGTDVHLRWRLALRTTFQEAFAAGLVAVDVDRDAGSGIAAYMLERTQ